MKRLLLIPLLFLLHSLGAQSTDFILVRKKNKTVATWFENSHIAVTTTSGAYIEADITKIKNDSIFLIQYIVQPIMTRFGFYVSDTVGSYRYQYHYNDIKAIGRLGRKFNMSGSAASLIGGSILLAVGSGVVYLADRKKFSPELLGAAIGLGGLGVLIAKISGKGMVIGKKYSLLYVGVSTPKKA